MTERDRAVYCARAINKFLDAAAAVRAHQRSAECSAEDASLSVVGMVFTEKDLQAADDFRRALDALSAPAA